MTTFQVITIITFVFFHFHFRISGLNSYYLSLLVTKLYGIKYHLSCNYVERNRKRHKKKQRKKVHGHWPPPVTF